MAMWTWFLMPGCTILLMVMWLIFGKDKKTITTITVSPPEDLDPLEMEFAQIATISDRGIFAMLLYWVSKGILQARDEGERVAMERVGELPESAPEHARFLFQSLFNKKDRVWLDHMPAALTEHKAELRDLVAGRFKGKNAVLENDTMYPTMTAITIVTIAIAVLEAAIDVSVLLAVILAILLFCAMCLLQNGAMGFQSKYDPFETICGTAGAIAILIVHIILLMLHTGSIPFTAVFTICYLICIPCVMFMERRVNHRLYGQILGFRTFIETAEWDRLKSLSENNPHCDMDLLPYAMLFNMGTEWTRKFENQSIYPTVEKMEELSGKDK